jgi:hypothetical protein
MTELTRADVRHKLVVVWPLFQGSAANGRMSDSGSEGAMFLTREECACSLQVVAALSHSCGTD